MSLQTLGFIAVPVAGTPVNARVIALAAGTDSGEDASLPDGLVAKADSISVQSHWLNTGRIYIGRAATISLVTGANLIGFLLAAGDSISLNIERGMTGGLGLTNLDQLWIDAEIADDIAIVSYLREGGR